MSLLFGNPLLPKFTQCELLEFWIRDFMDLAHTGLCVCELQLAGLCVAHDALKDLLVSGRQAASPIARRILCCFKSCCDTTGFALGLCAGCSGDSFAVVVEESGSPERGVGVLK